MKKTPSPSATLMTRNAGYPSAGYSWYVVVVLLLVYILSFVDRSIVQYLVDPIRADLNINDFQFSLVHSFSFSVLYTIMGIPLGRLADSRSRRGLLGGGIALWCIMTILCGKANGFWGLFFARMGVGLGEACLVPCAYSLIADYFAREKTGTAIKYLLERHHVRDTGGKFGRWTCFSVRL